MDRINNIKSLDSLSNEYYIKSKKDRHLLFKEEHEMDITPLGEIEVFVTFIKGIVHSITKDIQSAEHLIHLKNEHLKTLKIVTIENGIPNITMILKYPMLYKYVEIWEELRLLCIDYLENEI